MTLIEQIGFAESKTPKLKRELPTNTVSSAQKKRSKLRKIGSELTGLQHSQLYTIFESMCQKGLLQRMGNGRNTHYILNKEKK